MSQKTLNLCLERYNFVKFGETNKSTHTVLCTNNAHSVNSDKYRLTPTAIASKHGEGYVFTLNYDFDRPLFTIVQKSYSIDGTSGKILFEGIDPISKDGSKYLRRVEVSPVKLSDSSYLLEVTKDEYLRIGTTGAALGDEGLESLNEKIVTIGGIEKSVETVGGKQVLKLDASGSGGAKEIVYFDVDPSDPPSGIYSAITEALSNNKEPVIKNDGNVYFYSSTSTEKYIFVGGYGADVVRYTTLTVSNDDSIVEETVDVLEGKYFPLYYHQNDDGFTVADKTGHALTKTEIADAYRAGQIFMFSSYPASNTQAHWGYCCDIKIDSDNTGYAEFFILAAFGGDSYAWEKYRINLSSNTEFVTLWGPNTSYSKGYSGSFAKASDVAALQSQVSSLSNVSAYTVKGEATVAQLNAGPSGIQAGWAYQLTDSGTLTNGSLSVVAGDTVAWDGTKWFPLVKSDYYATKTYAQNVAHSIAPEFDPNKVGGYKANEVVTYQGKTYIFKVDHTGVWSTAHVNPFDVSSIRKNFSNYTITKVRTSVDVVEFVERNAASANLDVKIHFKTSTYTSNMLMLICPTYVTVNVKLTAAQQAAIVDKTLTIVVPSDQYLIVNADGNLEVTETITANDIVAARNVYGNFAYGCLFELYEEYVAKTICKNVANFESGFSAETTGIDGTKILTSLVSEFIDVHELSNRSITIYRNSTGSSNVVIYNSLKEKINYFGINGASRTINLSLVSGAYYIRFQFEQGADAYIAYEDRVIWRTSNKVGSVLPVENSRHPSFYTLCAVLNRVDCSFVERNQRNQPLDVVFTFKSTNEPYFFIEDDKGADKDIYLTDDQKGDIVGDKLTMSIPYGGSLVIDKNFNFAIRSSDANVEKYDIVMARNVYANFGYGAMQALYEKFKFNTIKPTVDVLQMYQDDEIAVNAISRKGYTAQQTTDFCLLLLTDTHNDNTSVMRGLEISDAFDAVKSVLYLGDATASKYDLSQVTTFVNTIKKSTKPFFFVTGNHDVGFEYGLSGTASQEDIYNSFISPLVEKGWITSGEYTEDKAYYYHDFTDDKIRLICLYEYDVSLKLEESVWDAVTYNSSYPNVVVGTTYSVGDYVNVEGYTAYSFKAKVNVDTTGGSVWNKDKLPSWTCPRGRKAIQKDQADWLAATLLSTPQDYRVIVAMHNPFSATCTTDTSRLFCKDINLAGSSQILSVMDGNLIEDMIAAFIDGTTCSGQVKFTGDATYMNTEGGGTYAYNYAYDFSSKNSGVKFLNFIGGHAHADYIWKSATNEAIWQVSPMCNGFQQEYAADIRRTSSLTKYGRDSITCYAVNPDTDKISLCKVGAKICIDGRIRNIEVGL